MTVAAQDLRTLTAFDQQHIWHPYTSMTQPLPAYFVERCEGVYLHLADGRRLVDGMSSWWCAVHGYNHPVLNAAVTEQVAQMSHVMFGGLTHRPAIALCQKLIDITPASLEKIFLCDSGSVSVEVAIKMALQYWFSRGKRKKSKLMTVRRGYHGDTFGAMSVCDPDGGMHHLFADFLPQQLFLPTPTSRYGEPLNATDEANLVAAFEQHSHQAAAFIIEPIVQGAGGMRIYSPAYLARVKSLCEEHDVLLIVDEIATGFGRTGKLFAVQHASIEPDIMCIGKALTGGMMTLAATLCSKAVAETICSDGRVLMHGPTFMANPLACSVALASIQLLATNDWQRQVRMIEEVLTTHLLPLTQHARVRDVRVLGAIGVVECRQNINVSAIQKYFVEQGVWIRPFRNLIYVMPPFISSAEHLEQLCGAIAGSLAADEHFE
ncbi:MAG: adenosylmethionine--8-amino-7-oxononanoate transaminase [Bacteroidota bacterium]